MDFKQARKQFEIYKKLYLDGALTLDELIDKVDMELEVEDKEGNFWKIDEEYENWLFYDRKNNEWIEKNPTEENNENINQTDTVKNFVTEIQIPSSPVLPENLKKFCTECGNKIEFDHKFCTKCGTKI